MKYSKFHLSLGQKLIFPILLSLFLLSASQTLYGQGLVISPIGSYPSGKTHIPARIEEGSEDTTRISYPFFDDFTSVYYRKYNNPDTSLWLANNGGGYVNDSYGIKPPSFGLITLDGINYLGKPYNFTDRFIAGEADNLTSRRIDLSKTTTAKRLALTFYWQSQGNGSKPDAEDYLLVQFKDSLGNWVNQWQRNGNVNTENTFQYVSLPVNSPIYFHKNFQFRFQVFCRLSGAYDTWNLDYILLDSLRRTNVRTQGILDITSSRIDTHYLKRYRAMPIDQFYANARNETVDSLFMFSNNLHETFNVFSYDAILTDLVKKERLGVMRDSSYIILAFNEQKVAVPTNRVPLPQNREKMILEYKFRMNTGEKDGYIKNVNLRSNDTIVGITVLDNYYAYDDGTAEFAATINQRFGKLAYRYVLNIPAVLTHIDLMFVPIDVNLKGETYNLRVWKNLDFKGRGAKDSVLLVQNIILDYADSINKFTRIELSRRLALSDTFYVGFEQLSDKNLTIGFDKNTDSGSQIFTNTTNEWLPNKLNKGSLMLRPVFLNKNAVSSNERYWTHLPAKIYPNPSNGELIIEGKVNQVQLVDMQGKVVLEKTFFLYENYNSLDLSHLSNGLYLLFLQSDTARAIQKVVIQK
ncbi:MAG: T9SS type A sorting domain-containing protein [Thermoflexibacter sp.]|nr:T9SS type A sorting domain-containing protein [Thermoflexibacter sp.]